MNLWEIEKILRRGAFTLGEALHQYWPGKPIKNVKDYTHDIPEANLTLHIGAAFIQSGFDCFAQHFFGRKRLDLLALSYKHQVQVRCEAKLLWDGSRAKSSADDLSRINKFTLNTKYDKGDYPNKIGLLIISTWDERILEWWENPVSDAPAKRIKDKNWTKIKEVLGNANEQKNDDDPECLRGLFPLSWNTPEKDNITKWMRTHGMLYLIYKIY